MNRRDLLRLGGMASLGATLQACAPKAAAQLSPRRPMARLAPVNVAFDRIIRTTIGLRPFRPSGFVLRTEQLDGKTIVHNFGHGGSGMSLSWGTASMATAMAMSHLERNVAVLGSGVAGLTSARELQRHGFDVTIYAATVPPDTTSNMSLAGFTPTSGLIDFPKRTPAWDAQLTHAVRLSYQRLQLLLGPKYGVTWIKQYSPTDNEQAGRGSNQLLPPELQGSRVILQPGEHPFPTKYAIEREEMRIEPSIYLDALMNDFLVWGGKVVIRKFATPRDFGALRGNRST